MPTAAQLRAAGRTDLVALVTAAGGFSEVSANLGLRAWRKPSGFWDSLEALDNEIASFVAAGWTELPDPDHAGKSYWYNQVRSVNFTCRTICYE